MFPQAERKMCEAELDRKPAILLEALDVDVPVALPSS